MFLVVYGHNFPFCEKYIYSFHMPLFLMVSGFFLPEKFNGNPFAKRFKSIMVLYFLWASFLFLFWFLVGRKMGESVTENLSPLYNFIGIFYGQGHQTFMDWGIPMWFLPNIFFAFGFLYFGKIYLKGYFAITIFLGILGLLYAHFTKEPHFKFLDETGKSGAAGTLLRDKPVTLQREYQNRYVPFGFR